jgi:hypothetical protein
VEKISLLDRAFSDIKTVEVLMSAETGDGWTKRDSNIPIGYLKIMQLFEYAREYVDEKREEQRISLVEYETCYD